MKKYLQITVVLGAFFLLVFLKQQRADDKDFVPIDSSGIITNPIPNTTSQSAIPTSIPTSSPMMGGSKMMGQYRDGSYTGSVEDAYYGNIQVQAIITGGKITDVIFLQYPNDNKTSRYINGQAMPLLKQEAIQIQSANVSGVSGASATSPAFIASLINALNQAK
nr:FMN-binding protein [Candidatus Levybacteria bacterium]